MPGNVGGIYAAIRDARREINKEVLDLRLRVRRIEWALIALLALSGSKVIPWSAVVDFIK